MTMHDGIVRQRDRFKKIIASKDTSSYKVVYPRQLVVGFPIDEGVIYVQNFDEPGIMSPAYNVWDVDNSKVNPVYLELALHSPQTMTYYAAQMKGTTARRRTLSTDKLRDIKISLPPMDKQVEIVARFKRIKELLRVGDERISNLDELVKSRFVEMFGDPDENVLDLAQAQLGDILSAQPRNGLYKPQSAYRDDGEGRPIVRIDSFEERWPGTEGLRRLDCTEAELKRYGLHTGDIVINRVNSVGNMGKSMCVGFLPEPTVFESNMMRLRPDESKLLPEFLDYELRSPYSKAYFETHAKRAIGQASINQTDVKSLTILLPSIAAQCEFLDFAARVDKLRFEAQKQKDELQTLYDSLAQEYFAI